MTPKNSCKDYENYNKFLRLGTFSNGYSCRALYSVHTVYKKGKTNKKPNLDLKHLHIAAMVCS
jgi:hypothetical protein